MGSSTHLLAAAALAAAAFLAGIQGAEPEPQDRGAAPGEKEADPAQADAARARLAKRAGTWDVTMTMAGEGGSKSTFKGVDRSRVLGDRWLISDFEADFMGAPFQGHGVLGYDPVLGKHVQTWVDSGSERPVHSQGDYDETSRTLTMTAEILDPATGEPAVEKHVWRWIDDDTVVFEMYMGGVGQPMVLEAQYKRRP